MYNLKTYIEFLNEKFSIPTKKWVDIDLMKIDDEQGAKIWSMYIDTYLPQGMDLSADNWKELQHKYKASWLIDVDKDKEPDAFIIYKNTKFGNKVSLLGTNGNNSAKKILIEQLFKLLNSKGWYIEASMKLEKLLSNSTVNVIDDFKTIQKVIPDSTILKDGYYSRPLSKIDKIIVKRLYGNLK